MEENKSVGYMISGEGTEANPQLDGLLEDARWIDITAMAWDMKRYCIWIYDRKRLRQCIIQRKGAIITVMRHVPEIDNFPPGISPLCVEYIGISGVVKTVADVYIYPPGDVSIGIHTSTGDVIITHGEHTVFRYNPLRGMDEVLPRIDGPARNWRKISPVDVKEEMVLCSAIYMTHWDASEQQPDRVSSGEPKTSNKIIMSIAHDHVNDTLYCISGRRTHMQGYKHHVFRITPSVLELVTELNPNETKKPRIMSMYSGGDAPFYIATPTKINIGLHDDIQWTTTSACVIDQAITIHVDGDTYMLLTNIRGCAIFAVPLPKHNSRPSKHIRIDP
jgi:hypothetical protein